MADTQLQHDADFDTLVSQLAAFQNPVLPLNTICPGNNYEGLKTFAQLGIPPLVASTHKQADDIVVDLKNSFFDTCRDENLELRMTSA